jgi:hypothetical protein
MTKTVGNVKGERHVGNITGRQIENTRRPCRQVCGVGGVSAALCWARCSKVSSRLASVMEPVTKAPLPKRPKCRRCGKGFKPKTTGRPALFCSASCRQRAYEKRRLSPFSASDALALDLLPRAAQRKVVEEVRLAHMLELIMNGAVPLKDPAQIDGILDRVKGPERMPLLRKIEGACQRRADHNALTTIASWRFSQQQRQR